MTTSNGCLPISHDVSKDWSHFTYYSKTRFGALKFPDFMLPIVSVDDQKLSQYCTAFTVASAIENQTGVAMAPEWQTAQIGKLQGAPIFGGADPKLALQSAKKGALPVIDCPLSFERDGWQLPAQWQSYNADLEQIAIQYKRAGWYNVLFGGPDDLDAFDMTRLALNDARADNAPIMAFGFWNEAWNQAAANPAAKGIMPMPKGTPTRHAYLGGVGLQTIGNEQYIVAQLSQGKEYGDNGLCYFSRAVWNAAWANPVQNQIGMYVFRSKAPPLWNLILAFISGLWRYTPAVTIDHTMPDNSPQPPVEGKPEPVAPKLLWDTPANVRHSLRTMCDDAGLPFSAKEIITACIFQESRFNPKAIGKPNKNGTVDYGLCQYNTGKNAKGVPYWIGKGAAFASIEEVLNDPEKNVRVMIDMYEIGKISLWSSFKTGAYKRWLGKV